MSGGALEYVMANYNDMATFSGFSDPLTIESKYYNKYISNNVDIACNGSECLSHGLRETYSWYGDARSMVNEQFHWLLRGGYVYDFESAGVFYFGIWLTGDLHSHCSFRLVSLIQ